MINNCRFAIDAMQNPVEFEYENMGENINTEYSEYLPFISVEGEKFIFTRLLPILMENYRKIFIFLYNQIVIGFWQMKWKLIHKEMKDLYVSLQMEII